MAFYSVNEQFIATEGQKDFTTTQGFNQGSENVYLNGLHCDSGVHYTYPMSNTIEFIEGLTEGDSVSIVFTIYDPRLTIDIIDTQSKNALYKRYTTVRTIENNMKFSISLIIKDKPVNFSFLSKFSPCYTTIKKVRTDTVGALNMIPDEDIDFQIYLNSKEAQSIYIDKLKTAAETNGTVYTAPTTYPDYIKQWVRYKTELDMLNGVYLSLSAGSGTQIKRITPLDIEKTVKLPLKFMDTLKRTQALFDTYDNMLQGSIPTSQVFVKANSTDTYPLNARLF